MYGLSVVLSTLPNSTSLVCSRRDLPDHLLMAALLGPYTHGVRTARSFDESGNHGGRGRKGQGAASANLKITKRSQFRARRVRRSTLASARLVPLERAQLLAVAAFRRLAPAAQMGQGEAEQVEDAAQRVIDHLVQALRPRVEGGHRRRDDGAH